MKIHIPNSAFLGNIDSFLKGFDPEDETILEITANDKWISAHPLVISMIASLGALITDKSRIVSPRVTAKSIHYLERMGLFRIIGVDPGIRIEEHEPAGRFIPLVFVSSQDELSGFIRDMIPLLHLEPQHAEPIRYIIGELVRNVIEHSRSEGAFVCCQYYKKTNRIALGVVDSGVGIRRTIGVSHKVENDLEAIKLALTPGITGMTNRIGGTDFNAGAGLFFIKSIATVNRDFFIIYSGTGMYKLLKRSEGKRTNLHSDPFRDNHSRHDNLPEWKGTAVGIDITLDKTKEFNDILDLIGDVFHKEIREQKRRRYRKPRFI